MFKMRKTLLAGAILVTGFALHPAKAKPLDYVSEAVNQISALYQMSPDGNADKILATACELFTKVERDPDFDDITKQVLSKNPVSDSVSRIIKDMGSLNNFLDEEQKILQSEGYSHISSIMSLSEALKISSRVVPDRLTAASLKADISTMKTNACKLAQAAQDDKARKERLPFIVTGTFGLALTVGDLVAAFYSLGISSLATTASISLGGGLISGSAIAASKP